jgi:hypothetical protein
MMAGDAVLPDQMPMKGDELLFAGDRHAFGRDRADIRASDGLASTTRR